MGDGFRTALFAKLNGDAVLTNMLATTTAIYHRRAPLGAAFPFIIYQKQSGVPIWAFDGPPIADQLWLVRGVDRSAKSSTAEDIDKRVDAILTDAILVLSDGRLMYLRRESDVDYEEGDDPDYQIHHVGGLYRTKIDRE